MVNDRRSFFGKLAALAVGSLIAKFPDAAPAVQSVKVDTYVLDQMYLVNFDHPQAVERLVADLKKMVGQISMNLDTGGIHHRTVLFGVRRTQAEIDAMHTIELVEDDA